MEGTSPKPGRSLPNVLTTRDHCSRCGADLPAEAPGGHCPSCLVQVALGGGMDRALFQEAATADLPRRCGNYELMEEVARGGMGVVYRARQLGLNRIVALKTILAGEFASPEALRRFRQEASAVARLQHPNIVAIHEFGECDGQAYFTMDFVEGRTLADLTRKAPLPARQAAGYLAVIARGVQYAHDRGILHRDLKPSNILIDPFDQPRITDFGLARPLDADRDVTVAGQTLGSPGYVSPEQAFGSGAAVGPASDVYSLGALLYHVLTGRAPFQGESLHDVLLQVKSADPVPPRRLNPSVPLDLETICLKCLEKEAARRYATAAELAADLDAFLRDEPIRARPISGAGKLWRWCRRRPAVAVLSASVLLLLLAVAVSSTVSAIRVTRARQAEKVHREKAEAANLQLQESNLQLARSVSLLELQRAEDFFRANDAATGLAHLAEMLRRNPSNSIAASRLVSALIHRNWALPSGPVMQHAERVSSIEMSPDGLKLLSASWDKTARIWDADTGRQLVMARHDDIVNSARFNPAGDRFVTASQDGTARVWETATGQPVTPPLAHQGKVFSAEFSPDGRRVLTVSADKTARLWDAGSGALLLALARAGSEPRMARFSPDGERVAMGSASGSVRIWSARSGGIVLDLRSPRSAVETLSFSPDGSRLVSGHANGIAQLWNPATGDAVGPALGHGDSVQHAAFSPDSKLLLTCSQDGKARLWNAVSGAPGETLVHDATVRFGEFSPDGRTVVTSSLDITARLWEVPSGKPLCQPVRHREQIPQVIFSRDGRRIISASYDWTVQMWDAQPRRAGEMKFDHAAPVTSARFSADGNSVLTTSSDQTARLSAIVGSEIQARGEALRHDSGARCGDLSRDGRRIATGGKDGKARLWDARTMKPIGPVMQHAKTVWSIRFSPDSTRVVTASADGTARLWDAETAAPIGPALQHGAEVVSASFSADGNWVVTASEDASARVWDVRTGKPVTEPLRHLDHVQSAGFSPDGRFVVTASADNHAGVWDAKTGQLRCSPLEHSRTVERAVFSPDGLRVATASYDRTARVWDPATGQALTPPLRHDNPVTHVAFSPDGGRILTGGWGGTARLWDSATGRPLTEWLPSGSRFLYCAEFDPAGERIVVSGDRGRARLWRFPRVPTPVPAWLPALAEAVAGIRVSSRGNVEIVDRAALEAFARPGAEMQNEPGSPSDYYHRLVHWFFQNPSQRPVDPF